MSRHIYPFVLPVLSKMHPLTGEPIRAIGFRADGRPIFPIMGGDGSNDPPERPGDISEENWNALGDPGKQALSRERSARQQAERDRDAAVRERDAARARPAPPKPNDKAEDKPGNSGALDADAIAAIVKQSVDAAIKPFQEAETQRSAERAADRVREVVLEAAKPLLHDATDALANVDLAALVDDKGVADTEKVKAALEDVVKNKPHLAKSDARTAPFGLGGGAPIGGQATEGERVKSILGDMQRAAGVRVPTSTT